MEAQLGFTWNPETVIWKPAAQFIPPAQEKYELPAQLDFRLAEMPSIPSEKPVPLSFTNGGKKLIQYQGPGGHKAKSKPKPATSSKPQAKLKQISKTKPPQVNEAKPEWNSRGNTLGLFDPAISKKMPIEIKHAIKNDPSIIKKPKTFQDISEVPNKKKTVEKSKSSKQVKIEENLDVKFIADQEEIVKSLEKQLEREKIARRKLDEQFSQKMQEMEKLSRKVGFNENAQGREKVGRTGFEVNHSSNGAQGTHQAHGKRPQTQHVSTRHHSAYEKSSKAPQVPQVPQVYRKFEEFSEKYGNIHEVPTHDVGPMVLRAESSSSPGTRHKTYQTHIKTSSSPISNPKYTTSEYEPAIKKTQTSNFNPHSNQHLRQQINHFEPMQASLPTQSSHPNPNPEYEIQPRAQREKFQYETSDICENDPVLNSISAAMIRYKAAHNYSTKTTSPLISQVGGKYIAYYANELSEMLIDDILEDTVYDLQRIEQLRFKQAHVSFSNEAETHFNTILKEFEAEARLLQTKHVTQGKRTSNVVDKILNDWGEGEIVIEDKRREWTVELSGDTIESLRVYKKKFEEFQRVNAGGSDGKLWEIYGIIGDDLVDEAIAEVAKEYDETLQEFTERFINNEFS